jgi:drug/metabolite transporter superfamily protein YnfA
LRTPLLAPAVLGAATLALVVWLGAELDPGDFGRPIGHLGGILAVVALVYALAVGWAIRVRRSTRAAVALVLLVAVAARGALVLDEPVLSNDAFRYVWDGRVQANGINPYRYAPSDPALAHLRGEASWERLNRPNVRTAYPPAAEGLFAGLYRLHADSVTWTKLALTGADLALIGVLVGLLRRLGRPVERVLLYAWSPLAIFEIAGTGHVEVIALLLLALALTAALSRRAALTGISVALAALVKPYAILALPALIRRGRPLAIAAAALFATAVLAYAPYLGAGTRVVGYVPGYLREEGFTSGYRFYLLGLGERLVDGALPAAATVAYVVAAAALLAALAVRFARLPPARTADGATHALVLFVVLYVLVSPTYPWYALTAVALLPLARGEIVLPAAFIAVAAPFLYLHISVGAHPTWPRHLVYGGAALALLAAAAWAARSRMRASRARPALAATEP